jgi:hypothetical protein
MPNTLLSIRAEQRPLGEPLERDSEAQL